LDRKKSIHTALLIRYIQPAVGQCFHTVVVLRSLRKRMVASSIDPRREPLKIDYFLPLEIDYFLSPFSIPDKRSGQETVC
jgi:hypothetical protein